MKDFAQQKKDIKKNKSVSNITTGKSPVPIKLILALMVFPVVFLMGSGPVSYTHLTLPTNLSV